MSAIFTIRDLLLIQRLIKSIKSPGKIRLTQKISIRNMCQSIPGRIG